MKYEFKHIKNAIIQRGYTEIKIINGECAAETDDQKQLAIDNGGTSAIKKSKSKAVKE